MERVLIVEDEKPLARFLELELQHEGYEVDIAWDGRSGLAAATAHDYAFILLDIMIPGLNGIEVCRRLRLQKTTPILMLTARDAVTDRVSGLDSGADDYLVKPFAIEELLARMRALSRRSNHAGNMTTQVADLVLDAKQRTATRGGELLSLTAREFELLHDLLVHSPEVISRDTLLNRVWGYAYQGDTNIVDVYIRYLRSKVDDPFPQKLIHTVRGVGYVLREP